MNAKQEKALLHLTGQTVIGKNEAKILRGIADDAPYFAPARFLLTAGLKQTHPIEQWLPHAQRTNLYFSNPAWLQWQLEEVDAEPAAERDVIVKEEELPQPHAELSPVTEPLKEEQAENDLPEEESEAMDENEEPLPMEAENKISGLLSNQLADFKKPLEPGATLEIDADRKPLHTIDYFVSQGIKVDLSAMPQDKLTTHLRKFTDWLKQMKNVQNSAHPSDLGTNLAQEQAVAETARQSNETREVVTESMAEVLVQQGQVERAIQLYIKLSFLNPEKSSYFAAKIEQLKGI